MENLIICTSTNLFRTYLIYRFIHIFVGYTEKKKSAERFAYVIFFLVNTGLYVIFKEVWINVLSNLIGIGFLVGLYTNSFKTICFVSTIIYLINAGCDAFCIPLFVKYQEGQMFNQIYSIITVFLIFICELIAEKVISYKKEADTVQNVPLLLVPSCSIAIMCFIAYSENISGIEIIVISLGLLFMNFTVFYLYNLLVKMFFQKYENEILRQRLQSYANQIEIILQGEEKIKTLRHDMKHHINELKLLVKKDDVTKIGEYISQMEEFIHNPSEKVASGNMEIDSILNYMLQRAEREQLSVNVNVQLPEALNHSFDIVIVLGNLLENAIDAAKQTEEKVLNVKIKLKQEIIKIEIENSFLRKSLLYNKKESGEKLLITTKKNKSQHGIGVSSVKKIVDKHKGIMEINHQDKMFCVKVIMYMSQIEG